MSMLELQGHPQSPDFNGPAAIPSRASSLLALIAGHAMRVPGHAAPPSTTGKRNASVTACLSVTWQSPNGLVLQGGMRAHAIACVRTHDERSGMRAHARRAIRHACPRTNDHFGPGAPFAAFRGVQAHKHACAVVCSFGPCTAAQHTHNTCAERGRSHPGFTRACVRERLTCRHWCGSGLLARNRRRNEGVGLRTSNTDITGE